MDAAQLTVLLGLGITIVGVLWRVGTAGKDVGAKMAEFASGMTALAKEVASLGARVGHLEVERHAERVRYIEALEAEITDLRQGRTPIRPRHRQAG